MKILLSSLAREWKLIVRNGISLFMVAAPALLAVLVIVLFGAVRETTLRLAVDPSVDAQTIEKLEQIAAVERFDTVAALRSRIAGLDNVAGLVKTNGALQLLVEGNEGSDFVEAVQMLVGLADLYDVPPYRAESVAPKSDLAYNISSISVLLLSLFIGGATLGLSIVTERESGAIHAIAVSPLRFGGYLAGKIVLALLLSLSGIVVAAMIMGATQSLASLLFLSVCSVLTTGMMIAIIGAMAKNQIAAIGVLKLLMPLSLMLPISAIFVPDNWLFLYFVVPMYWQYVAIDAISGGSAGLVPSLISLAVSIPWFVAAVLLLGKRTNLRIGR